MSIPCARGRKREETLMAQYISLFQNNSSSKDVFTANPKYAWDTYFIEKRASKTPNNSVLINKGSWTSFDEAFLNTNFIYTGRLSYCFWDTGASQIAGVTRDPKTKFLV